MKFIFFSVQRLPQLQNLSFLADDDESRQLTDVHFLLQVPIQECGFHIHVVDLPPFPSRQREEAHGLHARNRSKNLIEINPLLLHKPSRDSLALCVTISPASFRFSLYTHFNVMARWP
jgi:hypothetical protein